jgi:hypothetical protein
MQQYVHALKEAQVSKPCTLPSTVQSQRSHSCHCVQGKRNLLWRCGPDGTPLEVRQLASLLPNKVAGECGVTSQSLPCWLLGNDGAMHLHAESWSVMCLKLCCSPDHHQSYVSLLAQTVTCCANGHRLQADKCVEAGPLSRPIQNAFTMQ